MCLGEVGSRRWQCQPPFVLVWFAELTRMSKGGDGVGQRLSARGCPGMFNDADSTRDRKSSTSLHAVKQGCPMDHGNCREAWVLQRILCFKVVDG